MSKALFGKRNEGTVTRSHFFSLLLLVLTAAGTFAVVHRYRAPGSTTVLESQTMDMSSMRAPVGSTPVATESVAQGWFQPSVTTFGSVSAQSTADLVARAAGQVTRVRASLGESVKAGQPLVDVNGKPLPAPIAGEIYERSVVPGALVVPGTVLLRLQKVDPLLLRAQLAPEYLSRVTRGTVVQVRRSSDSQRFPARVSGTARLIDPTTHTFTAEVELPRGIGAGQSDAAFPVPGEEVEMCFALGPPRQLISLPLRAVRHTLEGQTFAWVVQGKNGPTRPNEGQFTCPMHPDVRLPHPGVCPQCGMKLIRVLVAPKGDLSVRRRPLKLWGEDGQRVGVDGLVDGEEVVVSGYEDLEDGMSVHRVEWEQGGPRLLPPPVPSR